MRTRLKYVIGGGLLSLATLVATGGANALVINESVPIVAESGTVAIPAGDPLGTANWVGTILINEGGAAAGGDTVVVMGPVGAATAIWTSGLDDMIPRPPRERSRPLRASLLLLAPCAPPRGRRCRQPC